MVVRETCITNLPSLLRAHRREMPLQHKANPAGGYSWMNSIRDG